MEQVDEISSIPQDRHLVIAHAPCLKAYINAKDYESDPALKIGQVVFHFLRCQLPESRTLSSFNTLIAKESIFGTANNS